MAAGAPYLNYARTLFGGTSVPGVGTGQSPRKVQPTAGQTAVRQGAAPQTSPTFAEMQAQGQARPAPPPAAPAASAAMAAPAGVPAVPDWLAGAMRVPMTDEPGVPAAPTVPAATPPAAAPALPPTASAPNTPPPGAAPVDGTPPGGFGAPGQPASPTGDPVHMTSFQAGTVQSRAMLGLPTTPFTDRESLVRAWESLNPTGRQMFASTFTPAEMALLSTIDRYRMTQGMSDAQIEQTLKQIGTAPTQQVTGAPAVPGTGSGLPASDALPPWLAGDDLAQAYALQFQRGAENLDDEFNAKNTAIQEEMARRGLGDTLDSTIGGGRLYDSNVGRRSAKSDLLSQVAAQLGTSAWQRALGQQQFGLSQELGRGQLGLAQQAQQNAMEQFRQQMGLSRDQFSEMMREYDLTRGDNNAQFQNQLWLALLPYLKDMLPAGTDLSQFGGH